MCIRNCRWSCIQGWGGGWWGRINRLGIHPCNKAKRNIFHLLPFLPVTVVPMITPCCPLPALVLALLLYLPLFRYQLSHNGVSKNQSSNRDGNLYTGGSSHYSYLVVPASYAVTAPIIASYVSSYTPQTPSENPVDKSGEGWHCSPHLGPTTRRCLCCHIHMCSDTSRALLPLKWKMWMNLLSYCVHFCTQCLYYFVELSLCIILCIYLLSLLFEVGEYWITNISPLSSLVTLSNKSLPVSTLQQTYNSFAN